MSYPEDIYFSYTKNGFLYQFNARYDIVLNDWNVTFLVYHNNDNQIYLGEYTRFRKQILRKLNDIDDLEHRAKIIDDLDFKYVTVISSFVHSYASRIRRTKPRGISLFDYGKQQIDKLMALIITLNVDDLNVTKLDQKNTVSFYFVWNNIITATYYLYKQSDKDKFSSDY